MERDAGLECRHAYLGRPHGRGRSSATGELEHGDGAEEKKDGSRASQKWLRIAEDESWGWDVEQEWTESRCCHMNTLAGKSSNHPPERTAAAARRFVAATLPVGSSGQGSLTTTPGSGKNRPLPWNWRPAFLASNPCKTDILRDIFDRTEDYFADSCKYD